MRLRRAGGLCHIGFVEASRALTLNMGFPQNTGNWVNLFLGNRRLLVDFSILANLSRSIHFWLEHLLLAPISVSRPDLLSYGCSTRSTTVSS